MPATHESILQTADGLLGHAVSGGADECEITHAERRTSTIRIVESETSEFKHSRHDGYGVRLVRQGRISSASTSDHSRLLHAIDDSLRGASKDTVSVQESWHGFAKLGEPPRDVPSTYDSRLAEHAPRDAEDIALRMLHAAMHGKIGAITGSLHIVSEDFEICNTNGLCQNERSTYIAGFLNAERRDGMGYNDNNCNSNSNSNNNITDSAAHANTPQQHHFMPPAGQGASGIGHFSARTTSGAKPETAGRDAQGMCLRSDGMEKIESGRYTIIFEPYSVGELLAFVVSPNFDLKRVSESKSCLAEHARIRAGKVASEIVSICDDPHAPDAIGSHGMDAEGTSTSRRQLIDGGVFAGVYSDLFDYYKYGAVTPDGMSKDTSRHQKRSGDTGYGVPHDKMPQGGNAARVATPMGRGADPIPISAPHNMCLYPTVQKDAMSREEMIKSTKSGLLVGRLWYTYAVNPIQGDFSCTARSGVMRIKDGKITSPARPVRIMHNLPVLLKCISGVGDDARNIVQWASLPSITPSIRVDNVPVTSM